MARGPHCWTSLNLVWYYPLVQPETRYTKSGEVSIAYQVVGDGPIDVVFVAGMLSHLDFAWAEPTFTRLLRRLAAFSRLILFDKRGTGLSDPVGATPTFDERMDDVRAVMEAAGSPRAAIVGYSEGGMLASLFAATYPDRCGALVLYETMVSGVPDADSNPGGVKWLELDRMLRDSFDHWGEGRMLNGLAPSLAGSELYRRMVGLYERASVSPSAAADLWQAVRSCDVSAVLPTIAVPTLVLAHTDSPMPVEFSRYVAAHVADARLVEFAGRDHAPFGGNVDAVADEMEEFLTGHRRTADPDRMLATVMFTDIVGSTARAAEVGDTAWRETRERHDGAVRRELDRFGGREVKQTGDGFLAVFTGPSRAVQGAKAIIDACADLGLELRIGLHTGECEVIDEDITGMAVNIAARVCAHAAAGQILVTRTVRDLATGQAASYAAAGSRVLKGVPGEWPLYRVGHDTTSPTLGGPPDHPPLSRADRLIERVARHSPGIARGAARIALWRHRRV